MKKYIYLLFITFSFITACCELEEILSGQEQCADQIFTETRKVSIHTKFSFKDNNFFNYANKLTSSQIKSALQIPENSTVKSVSLNSAKFKYTSFADNKCRTLFANIAVISSSGGIDFLIMKEQNLDVPLIVGEYLANKYLNSEGVTELRRTLERYAANTVDTDLSFIITGDPVPKGVFAHFDLEINMEITTVYEVCRSAIIGTGERVCE